MAAKTVRKSTAHPGVYAPAASAGWQHTRARFDWVTAIVRPLVRSAVRGRVKKMLWKQGVLRHSHEDIFQLALHDWRAL